MKEGSFNESQVLRVLPSFFKSNLVVNGRWFYLGSSDRHDQKYKIEYIQVTGLMSSRRDPMISDSPDALLRFTDSDGVQHVCAV